MIRRRPASAAALVLLMVLMCLASPALPARGAAGPWCVDDFASVQEAIDVANGGDIVMVPVGFYEENLTISQSIILQGGWNADCSSLSSVDPVDTVIHGGGAGPAVHIINGQPRLEALTLTRGASDRGGGARVEGASPTLANVRIVGNRATSVDTEWTYGAGVYVSNGTVTLDHTEVVTNSADAHPNYSARGGGVALAGSSASVVLIATRIAGNGPHEGADLDGGGIYVAMGCQVTAVGTESVITENRARSGGGVYSHMGVSRLAIISNTAVYGGGLFLAATQPTTVSNNIIARNLADSDTSTGCGALLSRGAHFANNTVVDNRGDDCAGVETSHTNTGVVTLTNNIIVGHVVGIADQKGTITHTLVTNDVWDNGTDYQTVPAGATDLHLKPVFLDRLAGDYHLAPHSPMIDAGTSVTWVTTDFDGEPRPKGVSYDIGAYEWGHFAHLPLTLRG